MKVLITGKGSYIGEHIKMHLESSGFQVDEVDTIGDDWKKIEYSQYDSIVHVAAIVHDSAKKASEEMFKKVNTDLPVSIARLAKDSGVKQFVFLSTMGVYGIGKTLSINESIIDEKTPLNAIGSYGGSKLEAEKQLKKLEDKSFRVGIVRPPNVYGPGCRGNYISLFKKLAMNIVIFPYAFTNIRQSMLYIDNLSELIKLIIIHRANGIFLPQDDYIPNTVDLIKIIRVVNGRKPHFSKFMGLFMKMFKIISVVKKIYGGVCYDKTVSDGFDNKYQIVSFAKGMELTYKMD